MADQSNLGNKILITGIVLGLAAGGWGIALSSSNEVAAPDTSVDTGKVNTTLSDAAKKMKADMQADRKVEDTAPKGATINGQPRLAPLFFSTELWQFAADDKKMNLVVDIYDPESKSIHGDVPNTWFVTSGIADALGRADGLDIDSDKDGFTNGEEYKAQTKPADPASYPAVLAPGCKPKLELAKLTTARATITTDNMNSDPAMNPTEANIRILGPDGTTVVHKATVKIGESFGLSPKDGKRFKLLGYEKKTFPGFADDTVEENVISVQDTETAGPEKQFTVRAGNPNPKLTGDAAKGHLVSDTTATLRVTGGSALGTPKATVKAELNAEFTIPGGAGDGKDLKATFVSTDPTGGINVTPAGAQAPICIPKVKAKHAEE